jgi:hypothetical protein
VSSAIPNPRLKARIDLVIRVAAPVLDLMLVIGDRVSRVLERDDPDYPPAQMTYQGDSAPRGLTPRSGTDHTTSSAGRPSTMHG